MAIDSAVRRFSMMDFDLPIQPGMGPPNASPDAGDREHMLWLYAFDAGGTVTPPPADNTPIRFIYGLGPHPKQTVHPHPVFNTRN